MVLTGKALEDFGDNCKYDYHEFIKLDEACRNALIIDWFDSVGIYIVINYYGKGVYVFSIYNERGDDIFDIPNLDFSSRKEATKQAIIKANQIYNENNQRNNYPFKGW